jgi:hyperosmotically inducible protein
MKVGTIALLAGAALILAVAGCAGNRYSRSTGEYIDDNSLEVRVDHALGENPDYKFKDVKVAVYKGVTQLNGFVDSDAQRNQAGSIVQQVPGVRQVQNNLSVSHAGPRTDGQIADDKALAARVSDALHNNPEYKFDGVKVAANSGVVQLSGFVNVADQKNKAADLARQIQGVNNVENDIMSKDTMTQ